MNVCFLSQAALGEANPFEWFKCISNSCVMGLFPEIIIFLGLTDSWSLECKYFALQTSLLFCVLSLPTLKHHKSVIERVTRNSLLSSVVDNKNPVNTPINF